MKALFDRGRHRRHASGAGVRKTPVRVLVVLAAAMFMLLIPSGGYAVHDLGLFELDGNTADSTPNSAAYDWESVFDSSGNQILTSAAEPKQLSELSIRVVAPK